MKLPLLFGKKEKPQYFLALLLRDEKANAVIFEELSGKVRVIGENVAYFPDSIETATIDELLQTLDTAISTAESALPKNVETQKTVFGVKDTWVDGVKIKKEYLAKLKKVSDTLGLTPIGFLVLHEAIAHYLQQEEGAPVSAILVEVGKKEIVVSLLRAGRIMETKRCPIAESVPKSVDSLLHHFTASEILPSRIIIFDGSHANERLAQEFIAHSWNKDLPFLHVPHTTILEKGLDAKAVLFGAAKQMGFEVLGENQPEVKNIVTSDVKETVQPKTDTKKNDFEEEKEFLDFGFIREKDVALEKRLEKHAEKSHTPAQTHLDTLEETKEQTTFITTIQQSMLLFLQTLIKKIKQVFPKFSKNKPHLLPNSHSKKLLLIPIIIIFTITTIVFYTLSVKATVTLSVTPNIATKQQDITISTSNPKNTKENALLGNIVSVSENGERETAATGTKEIGEKAKGTVTIYNSNLSEGKKLQEGTILTASNDLKFTLDNATTIASASGDASAIKSSSTKATITAHDIGKEYNLPSGTKFTVANFDSIEIIAKNDTAFEGGSKKQITVVAKADHDKLIEQITKSQEEKAKSDLKKQNASGSYILPFFVDIGVDKKTFSKDIGEQATQVSLKATIAYKTIAVTKSKFNDFAKRMLSEKTVRMSLSKQGITYTVENIKQKSAEELTATIRAKASLIPIFDKKQIASMISGGSLKDAIEKLSHLPQVASAQILLNPELPLLPKTLPKKAENISLVININE